MRILAGILLGLSIGAAQTRLGYVDLGASASACCMAMDGDGNLYVAGVAAHPSTLDAGALGSNLVITKLDRDLNVVYRFVFGGGSGYTQPGSIAVDRQGNAIVVGRTEDPSFPVVNPLARSGQGFVSKLNAAGTQLLFSTFLSGYVDAVALDADGNLYLTGLTRAADFPVTPNAYQRDGPGSTNSLGYAFVSKLTNAGDRFVYSTFLGDAHVNCVGGSACAFVAAYTEGSAIAVSPDGTVTVAGATNADKFPTTPGAFQPECRCSKDVSNGFVTRLNADGSALLWSTFLGGSGYITPPSGEKIQTIALTPDGGVVVAGTTDSSDFPVTPGAFQSRYRPITGLGVPASAFVTRLNSGGTGLVFSTYVGGSVQEQVHGFALDPAGDVWLTGPRVLRISRSCRTAFRWAGLSSQRSRPTAQNCS